jgi:hypothetical protein
MEYPVEMANLIPKLELEHIEAWDTDEDMERCIREFVNAGMFEIKRVYRLAGALHHDLGGKQAGVKPDAAWEVMQKQWPKSGPFPGGQESEDSLYCLLGKVGSDKLPKEMPNRETLAKFMENCDRCLALFKKHFWTDSEPLNLA